MENHICRYCGKEFESGYLLGNHISKLCDKNPNRGLQKNSKIWTCTICNDTFSSRSILRNHRKNDHSELNGKYRNKFYGIHA